MNNNLAQKNSKKSYPMNELELDGLVDEIRILLFSIGYSKYRPFANLINSGSKIVLKPNWVIDSNPNDKLLLGTVTHPSIIFAVAELVAESINGEGEIVIGDAPIQSCNFDNLLEIINFSYYLSLFEKKFPKMRIIVEDWRLTKYQAFEGKFLDKKTIIKQNPFADDYLIYKLGTSSFLEEISKDSDMFRVTCYPASLMKIHHYPGNHEYLLSNTPMSADLLINLPKLKTHLKTGLTGALKNLVGINGNKEYLPHHRRGGLKEGGDCYPNSNLFRRVYDRIYDDYWENINISSNLSNKIKELSQEFFRICSVIFGGSKIDAGSWSGNDTIWRTVLDLNSIIYFADKKPKHVISLVDGIISGEGDGPLKSIPKPLGIIIASTNPLIIDLLISKIIGYDYAKIPLIFQGFYHEQSKFKNLKIDELILKIIETTGEICEKPLNEYLSPGFFQVPIGWKNAKVNLTDELNR